MMTETYHCPDVREVALTYNEDRLSVEARSRDGMIIGSYRFALVGADGETIELMDEPGEAVSFKLAETNLADGWHHQGITERVMDLVADEISISPIIELPNS